MHGIISEVKNRVVTAAVRLPQVREGFLWRATHPTAGQRLCFLHCWAARATGSRSRAAHPEGIRQTPHPRRPKLPKWVPPRRSQALGVRLGQNHSARAVPYLAALRPTSFQGFLPLERDWTRVPPPDSRSGSSAVLDTAPNVVRLEKCPEVCSSIGFQPHRALLAVKYGARDLPPPKAALAAPQRWCQGVIPGPLAGMKPAEPDNRRIP